MLETPNLLWLILRLSSIRVPNFITLLQAVLWAAIESRVEVKKKSVKKKSTKVYYFLKIGGLSQHRQKEGACVNDQQWQCNAVQY